MTPDQLPSETVTADAWVSLDAGTRWGSIVGFYQDNGSYEKGWLLGYNDTISFFPSQPPPNCTRSLRRRPLKKANGIRVRRFVRRKEHEALRKWGRRVDGSSAVGKIAYPEKAYYTIGAYRDQDEFFRMQGSVHRVRLFGDALTANQIRSLHAEGKSIFPRGVTFSVKPHLRFDSPRSATIYWETDEPGQAILQYGQGKACISKWKAKRNRVTIR